MKKLILFALTAVLSLSLTSCESDPDDYVAYSLEGTWEGISYNIPDDGEDIYTVVEFYGDPYHADIGATGTGFWYDEYWDHSTFKSRFKWEVFRENIRIYLLDNSPFYEDNILSIERNSYVLDYYYFEGYIKYFGGKRKFHFEKVGSFNWGNDWGYHYAKKTPTDFSEK